MAIAIDFETVYTKDYSLRGMSTWNYVNDNRFDAYLVAAYSDTVRWVGHPKDFDWALIKDQTVVMHNAGFDALVLDRLTREGVVPVGCMPANYFDTADMVASFGMLRNLKNATKYLLPDEPEVSKDMRDRMKGIDYAEAVRRGLGPELLAYGARDAELTYKLWEKYNSRWPAVEQRISTLTREAGLFGLALDTEATDAAILHLGDLLHKYQKDIPWIKDGEKPLSTKALRLQGRIDKVPVPASISKKDEDWLKVVEEYGSKFPWVVAAGEYRRVNTLLKRVQSLQANARTDGTLPYQMKYFGAGPGRWSGGGDSGGKFNVQNMPRKEMFGVDLRKLLIARPGHTFAIVDYSQIEARLLLWLVQDKEFLSVLAVEGNIYQAYAKKVGWYPQEGTDLKADDYNLYQLAKAAVLQLGYYAGPKRFMEAANAEPYFLGLTLDRAQEIVSGYRRDNPRITGLWRALQNHLAMSAATRDDTHEIELPSGRVIPYWYPRKVGQDFEAVYALGEKPMKIHSGILTNNLIQGTARDILRDAWIAVVDAGYRVVLTVHDEIVCEVPLDGAEAALADISRIMVTSSPWAAGAPLDVEGHLTTHYCK